VSVWTGASTAPELDGLLAAADGIDLRMPYQSDPVSRAKINAGGMDYLDLHLSHVAQMVWKGGSGISTSRSWRSRASPRTAVSFRPRQSVTTRHGWTSPST
jgi:acyl-CoA hydrolase